MLGDGKDHGHAGELILAEGEGKGVTAKLDLGFVWFFFYFFLFVMGTVFKTEAQRNAGGSCATTRTPNIHYTKYKEPCFLF